MGIKSYVKNIVIMSILLAGYCVTTVSAKDISFLRGSNINYMLVTDKDAAVVHSALQMFADDVCMVLNAKVRHTDASTAQLLIATLPRQSQDPLAKKPQGFRIEERSGKLYVTGADAQGTAYGIMELSRLMGVSPWTWWADSKPVQRKCWMIPDRYYDEQSPAVEYRGIFINDEDSGFCPWSWKTYDPSTVKGRIGPKTHERVFQLMLRLRANVFWPAMHACSVPFYLTVGNREMADRYGIIIGTSHCEPMLRNTNGEWSKSGKGEYNFITNRDSVLRFWEERVLETAYSGSFYTLGMRGIHDTGMLGVEENNISEQRNALQQVICAQRTLLQRHIKADVSHVLQVFIPYKEVLPIYKAGLEVPDDVTLMWCDDNYGYIRHLPTACEQRRSGGNGVYYHFSYWGRPQSHTWLPSTSPALVQVELERAYRHGVRKIWVFNVGDIKPNEFLTEYGLELAWNYKVLTDRNSNQFMQRWLCREFGEEAGEQLLPVMQVYYDLSYHRRAEMLGNTRVEEKNPAYKQVSDLPWTDGEICAFLERCRWMEHEVLRIKNTATVRRNAAAYFELVEYPCLSYAAMARKMLTAQLARHGKASWQEAVRGHRDIFRLTEEYHGILDGKWNYMMGFWKGHSMFKTVDTTHVFTTVPNASGSKSMVLTPKDGTFGSASYLVEGLGYSKHALALAKGDDFTIMLPASVDSLHLTLAFVPGHPVDSDKLEVRINVEGVSCRFLQYQTQGRSEEWKRNIECNQAYSTFVLPPSPKKRRMTITAITEAVLLDEIEVTACRYLSIN